MTRRLLMSATILVLVLGAGLFALLRRDDGPGGGERLLGGLLLDMDPATVSQIIVTEHGRQHRLERGAGTHWSLRGAIHDWVEPQLLAIRLTELAGAQGGAVLAGTVPEDRRYEFNGPDGVRLVVVHEDGREVRLAMGATNPVTGFVYASGGGRPGCFPIMRETRDVIAGLAESVRLLKLLPPVDLADLASIDLAWGDRPLHLWQADGRWWLQVSGPEDPRLPDLARDYHGHYDDRWRREEGRLGYQAHLETVGLLVHDITDNPAAMLVGPDDLAQARAAWGLDRIWRRVDLHGEGIDPDPSADRPDHLSIAFAAPLDPERIPFLRRDLPLLAGTTPRQSLDLPLDAFADRRALTMQVMPADTVLLAGQDGLLLRVAHDRTITGRFDGRHEWVALPPLSRMGSEEDAQTTASHFVVEVDRLATLAVLPPTSDRRVLKDDERLKLTLVWNDPPHREEYEVGVLDPAYLPPGSPTLADAPANPGPVGLWRPADGRLLQVSSNLVLTGRNLARASAQD